MRKQEEYLEKLLETGGKIVKGRSSKYIQVSHPALADGVFLWLGKNGAVRRGRTIKESFGNAKMTLHRCMAHEPFVPSIQNAAKIEVESTPAPKNWPGPKVEKPRQKAERRVPPSFEETAAEQKAREQAEWEAEYYASLIA